MGAHAYMPEYVCARLHVLYDKRTLNLQGHTCKNECVVGHSKVNRSQRKKEKKKRAYGLPKG